MNRRPIHCVAVALALAGQAPAAPSGWDDTQLQLLAPHSTPFRWYNVEGPPYWVAGPRPQSHFGGRLHRFHLQPGQEVLLHGPAGSWLRLAGEGKPLDPGAIEISVSSDARAFTVVAPIKTTNPDSLLVALPLDKPSLIRLARPPQAGAAVSFAACISREEPFSTLAPYRDRIRLPGRAVQLRRDDQTLSEAAWLIKPESGTEFPLVGPARVQLLVRLPWPEDEPLREQSLVLRVQLDHAPPFPLLLTQELDARRRTRVNHSTELVSCPMNGFITVPAGRHILRLQPALPVYLSAYRQPPHDFLLPGLNAPTTNATPSARTNPAIVAPESSRASASPAMPRDDRNFGDQEQYAWRLARDNNPRDAGAQAADFLNRLAQTRPDYPAAQQTATGLLRERTRYQEILPARLPDDLPLTPTLFAAPRLRELFEPDLPVAVYNPTLDQVGDSLAEGHFAAVPQSPSSGLLYTLPPRSYNSRLRIAALAAQPARAQFFVQIDQQPPAKVALEASPALPAGELEPSAACATLRVLERGVQLATNLVAGQPVGEFDLPFSVSEPGVVELPLPQRARQLRIYQEPPATPVRVSVACRAAKPFELGESMYLSLLSQFRCSNAWQILTNATVADPAASGLLSQLHNHLLPLIRLLKAHTADFTQSVDLGLPPPGTNSALKGDDIANLRDTARNLEKQSQPLEALAAWNRLFWQGPATNRPITAVAIMRDLQLLDEDFLATQYARYALLKIPAPQIPAPAVARLESNALAADDAEPLEELRAFLFTRCPCPQHLAALIEALALNSRDDMVLSAGLLLPAEKRPAELMLAAALRLNWWQTFDRLVESLPGTESQCFWRAQKQLAFYHFADAEHELDRAGAKGAEMRRALQEGLRIRDRLLAPSLDERLNALFDWEQWQARQPGPRAWRDADDVACASPATESLYNCELDRFARWYRAEHGRPVTLRFTGPLRLQIEARPILEQPFEKPVDDWLEISEYGITRRLSICQSVPNPSLQLIGATNALAGLKAGATLDYGPGWHEVQVNLAGRAGLVHVLEEQPALPTRVLPTLNAERMNSVLQRRMPPPPTGPETELRPEGKLWWVPPELARRNSPASPRPPARSVFAAPEATNYAGLTEVERLRLALRLKPEPGSAPDFGARALQALPPAEQWLAACRWQRWTEFTNWDAVPEVDRADYLLATHQVRQVLESDCPRDVSRRLATLLEVAEYYPAWRKQAQCLGELLAAQTNCPPESKAVLLRLTRDLTWIPLLVSPISAGIRPVPFPPDLPQVPALRIRRALLPPAGTNEFTVGAQNAFAATLMLQHPAQVQLRAELARAGFSPLTPLTVSLQVDAREIQRFPLTPAAPAAGTNIDLAEGSHLVRLWIEDPVVNQFVRIRFTGRSEETSNSLWSQPLAETASEKRYFHAATASQPIRFFWKGPALLRLDEWRDGRFLSQYRLIQPGEQNVDVLPAPGQTESWYQIFVRAADTNQAEPRPVWATRPPEPAPPPKLRLAESAMPARVALKDYYRLGGQEDGTWSAEILAARRRPFEIDLQQKAVLNKFVEANVACRQLNPGETLWFSTEALARVHEPGDVTGGLAERIEGRPRFSPLDWTWSGEGFVGSTGPQQQDIQGALYTAFEIGPRLQLNRKLEYYPFAGLFAHYLTLGRARAAQYDYVDQDLFTRFRSEHRWGWTLGNQLEYEPWLDTQLRGYIDAASNQDFTPDHWGMRFSWYQLFGALRGEVAYRFTHFLADADRPSDAWRQGISATLYGEHWFDGRNRLELGVQYRHDWPHSGDSYFLVLRWDFSRGRGYQDQAPQDMVFRNLRNLLIPAAFNNSFQPGPPGASLP